MFKAQNYNTAIEKELSIVNKDKKEIPFVPNKAQKHLSEQMENHTDILILKARKMGFSSYVLAVLILKFLFGTHERLVSVSFDTSASSRQLERAKYFLRSYEMKNGVQLPLLYNSKKELVREGIDEQGRPFRNTLLVGSAQSTSFGRGDDITALHVTEAAFAPDIDELMSGIGEACIPSAFKILETTANGYGKFKTLWDKAKMGTVDFIPLFYGSQWEYPMDFINKKRANLGRLGPQEYPITEEEAFLTSGACYFDSLILKEYLEKCQEPLKEMQV